jgi:hypothetical protein
VGRSSLFRELAESELRTIAPEFTVAVSEQVRLAIEEQERPTHASTAGRMGIGQRNLHRRSIEGRFCAHLGDDARTVVARESVQVRRATAGGSSSQRPRDSRDKAGCRSLARGRSTIPRESKRASSPRIAPRRNNPEGAAWLPILHTYENGWHFTTLFSNTDRAHELGRVRDWVVVYFERDGHEGQCTIVTEYRGPLVGKRVVRGREGEVAALDGLPPGG